MKNKNHLNIRFQRKINKKKFSEEYDIMKNNGGLSARRVNIYIIKNPEKIN